MNRTMLARAWALGAGPTGGVVTIDPDATLVDTYGPGKEGSTFTYRGEVGLSPLIGVCGETGDVLALRARGGNAHPGRAIAGFIRECAAAIPAAVRAEKNLWVRIDSAGYQHDVFAACEPARRGVLDHRPQPDQRAGRGARPRRLIRPRCGPRRWAPKPSGDRRSPRP